MRIYQYRNSYYYGKIHVAIRNNFLCGKIFVPYIDIDDPSKINFSTGICKHCKGIYEIRHKEYKKDLNFEVIKLKLGINKEKANEN